MRIWGFGVRAVALSVGLIAASPLFAADAWAARTQTTAVRPAATKTTHVIVRAKPAVTKTTSARTELRYTKIPLSRKGLPVERAMARSTQGGSKVALLKGGKARYYGGRSSYGGLQCVPFARAASGIELKGNAANWWDAANGVYARGQAPESGSVLNFRATGHMRLGHVAVVARVVNSREIEIDHANWAGPGASKGGVSRAIPVVDVSENNDWSEVRVGLGHSGSYGSVYPTYGFIYDRPDNGMMASNPRKMPNNPFASRYDEVAEAPSRAIR